MKQTLLIAAFLFICLAGYSQAAPPKDTTKVWTIHGQNTLLINQSSFSNWAAGGVNSVAANIVLDYDFNYKKGVWSWDNKAIAGYGISKQNGTGWRKNDDRIILNSLLGRQASKYWLYTFYANFQTQFTKGYNYDATGNRTLLSAPFAPAYLTFGPGFAYKRSDNFRINLSPAAARITIVQNDSLSSIGSYGVTPGKKSLFEFGASLDAYYKVNLVENISFENILKVYSNYLKKPGDIYVDYAANIFMKVNKLVTVNAGVELINDPKAQIPEMKNGVNEYHSLLQTKQIFGVGLTYKF
ncbi:DUF3078 domain-containing protein [Mucilaginibacter sp. OK098]|uniref:DUF3078 domain-containing protein n=1 Tax=Mucilaginibacter sp. OK098 TaxID=1855297 RepID=UPI00091330EE|nr:DUF3078 domain-containing protein [Mucilaginibacter sp. OK098]SHN10929.1 outer membrane insertion C-terminal signal [Mucilaginibacter sp. OK098]